LILKHSAKAVRNMKGAFEMITRQDLIDMGHKEGSGMKDALWLLNRQTSTCKADPEYVRSISEFVMSCRSCASYIERKCEKNVRELDSPNPPRLNCDQYTRGDWL
jgi:hypothetical protein